MIRKRKYNNKIIYHKGLKFDSKKEFNHYLKLEDDLKNGKIKDFLFQVPFKYCINSKWIFTYNADFVITTLEGFKIVQDVKGIDKKTGKAITTSLFNLKKKIIQEHYKIKIEIV